MLNIYVNIISLLFDFIKCFLIIYALLNKNPFFMYYFTGTFCTNCETIPQHIFDWKSSYFIAVSVFIEAVNETLEKKVSLHQ